MTYQVYNPKTGEQAIMVGSKGPDAEVQLDICKSICNTLHAQTGDPWRVVQITLVYSTETKEEQDE
jgi:hypothetical protein